MNRQDLLQRAAKELIRSGQISAGKWEYGVIRVRKIEHAEHWAVYLARIQPGKVGWSSTFGEDRRPDGANVVFNDSPSYVFGGLGMNHDETTAMSYAIAYICQEHDWEFVTTIDDRAIVRLWVET